MGRAKVFPGRSPDAVGGVAGGMCHWAMGCFGGVETQEANPRESP